MGLSVPARAGLWLDGVAVAGQDLRLQVAGALLSSTMPTGSTTIAARQGVRRSGNTGSGDALQVQASSGMNITVNPGVAFVQGTTASNSGMYTAILDSLGTITVATSDPTNPRIDNVIVQVNDVGTSLSTIVVTLQTGTPAPSPSAPALPANSLLLATVAVAANTTTIVAGNITDARPFTVAQGGILPVASLGAGGAMTAAAGMYAHDLATGRLRVATGSGTATQPKTAAFAAVTGSGSATSLVLGPSYVGVVTVNVTVDGLTELEVYASWTSLTPASGTVAGDSAGISLQLDGIPLASDFITRVDSSSLNPASGGNARVWCTPSAGTHTLSIAGHSSGHQFTINGPVIRVAPSLQQ